jgi:tetratricopeptide (TPR) repeat protein
MGINGLITLRRINLLIMAVSLLFFGSCDDGRTAEQIYSSGIDYAVRGELEKAKKEFEKTLETDISHKPARESLKVINEILISRINNRAVRYFFKAISRSNAGRLDEANSFFSMAIKQSPDFVQAYYERGLVNAYKGKYSMAIDDFSKTVELTPDDAMAYNNRGLAYARGKKQYDLAIEDFNSAVKLDPDFAEAYDNRGIAYRMKSNDIEKACADWKQACKLNRCKSYEIAKQDGYCE